MENIQGGDLGATLGINLPLTAILAALGLAPIVNVALGIGLSLGLTGISLPNLPLGL